MSRFRRFRIGELDHRLGFRVGREHADDRALLPEHQRESPRAVYLEGDAVMLAHVVASGQLREPPLRSEEHTSELQSQSNLVCRLLLEKKKKIKLTIIYAHQV